METAVAIVNNDSPASMMMAAIEKGMDLEKLEKFMELQSRYEANQARKAYSQAMSDFKANPPEIEKDKKVSYKTNSGVTAYNHASLGNVTDKIGSSLSKYNLSAAWTTKQDGQNVTVTCRISHSLGHSEETSLTAALDTSGGKNTIQALGSTISYLERYTILALTGLATHDTDDDGKASEEIKYISDKEKSTVIDMFNSLELNDIQKASFFKTAGIEKDDFGKIKSADFNTVMGRLRATQQAKGKK